MSGPYTPALTSSMSALSTSGRPTSAASRNRIDLTATTPGTKVYGNNLFAGDVLAGEENTWTINAGAQQLQPKPPPTSNPRVTQQRAMSAQKRMDRLQMGGLAQATTDSRPGTPGTSAAAGWGASAGNLSGSSPGSPIGSGVSTPTSLSSGPSMSRLAGLAQPTAAAGPMLKANSFLGGPGAAAAAASGSAGMAAAAYGQAPSGNAHRTEAAWAADASLANTGASATGRALVARGLAASYDPSEDPAAASSSSSSNRTAAGSAHPHQKAMVVAPSAGAAAGGGGLVRNIKPDFSNMAAFLTQAGPQNGHMLCYIQREKGVKGHSYQLFYEGSHTFLLSARQVKKASGASYVISCTTEAAEPGSTDLMGKVRSNFLGTEFTISDGGRKPGKKEETVVGDAAPRKDLGAVTYQHNVLGTRGPRKMTATVPNPERRSAGGSSGGASGPSCLERLQSGNGVGQEVLMLRNKQPKWNDTLGAYCLNFNKRVTEASVKNFQLVVDTDEEQVVLQFGKVGDTVFTCDFMWPLTPVQAFAICLSSFDNKLACE